MAGDNSPDNVFSCTLRSNICDEAGEWRPGEEERYLRLGEAATAGWIRGLPRGEALWSGGGECNGDTGLMVDIEGLSAERVGIEGGGIALESPPVFSPSFFFFP